MKKRSLAGIALLGAVATLSASLLAFSPKANEAKATDPYTIGDDSYEVGFLEQYDDYGTAVTDENYSYANDKPIGNNTIAGHLYGTYGPTASLKQTNYETTLLCVNEALEWRFSGLNVKSKTDPNRLYIQLENNSSNWNIMNTGNYPQDTCPDEYAIGQIMTGLADSNINRAGTLISKTAISNIKDLSFYWRSSYTRRLFIYYQLDGETAWKQYKQLICDDDLHIIGNVSGTHGWDTAGYSTFNDEYWESSELYNATARIALVIAGKESGNLPLSAILINANNAAVRYLNALTYKEHICSDNGENKFYDLRKTVSDKVHNQDLFHLATLNADADFLANYEVAGTQTSETNALSFYNYLVSTIPGLGIIKGATPRIGYNVTSANSNIYLAIALVTGTTLAAVTTLLVIKKRKHN